MNAIHEQWRTTTMTTFDCPWCAEPAMVEGNEPDELTCQACGIEADLAPDPSCQGIDQAA